MRPAAACARSVGADVAALPQVEAVERLVGQQQRLRRQQADREQRALALALRERADRRVEQRLEIERLDDLVARRSTRPPKNPIVKSSAQRTRLRGPRRDRVGTGRRGARRARAASASGRRRATVPGVDRQHAGQALEQRRLAGAVRARSARALRLSGS